MAVATKEKTEVQDVPKTFKLAEPLDTTKDYHLKIHTVNSPANPGTISPDMLDAEVASWQKQGYRIHSVHFLGPYMPEGAPRVYGYIFAYHLVRGE